MLICLMKSIQQLNRQTQKLFWKALFQNGVFTNPVIAPAVPANTSRIRTSVMATHTDDQLDRVLTIFKETGKEMGLI